MPPPLPVPSGGFGIAFGVIKSIGGRGPGGMAGGRGGSMGRGGRMGGRTTAGLAAGAFGMSDSDEDV